MSFACSVWVALLFLSDDSAVLLGRYEGGQLTIPFIGNVVLGRWLLFFTSLSFIVTFALSTLLILRSSKFHLLPSLLILLVFQLFYTFSNNHVEGRVFLALTFSGWFGLLTAQFASAIKQLVNKES